MSRSEFRGLIKIGAGALLLWHDQLPERLRGLVVDVVVAVVAGFIAAYVYPDARAWLLRSATAMLAWSTVVVVIVYLSVNFKLRREQLSPAGWLAVGLLLTYSLSRRVAR